MNNATIARLFHPFLLCVFTVLAVEAQSQHVLTLDDALRIALDRSIGARRAREQLRASEASAEAARRSL